ncbi:MAG: putative Ig domain-containing protein [Alphaproteobacteria bacterium]
MKNFLTFIVVAVLFACQAPQQEAVVEPTIQPALYSDWDRAIRADVDLQNMFVATPRKITKPIDMYMAMALSLKYNYSKRLMDYQQALINAGKSPANKLPEIISQAGYTNINDYQDVNSELKVAWNTLDVSSVYFQSKDVELKSKVATEEGRKVVHNLLQETRSLYWKTLTAQKLLPTVDNMIEFLILEIDEMNAVALEEQAVGKLPTQEQMQLKRSYMNAVKDLSDLKRSFEASEVKLSSLMGFHPNTTYSLVGKEYGNFDLPIIKNNLSQLEWVALTNRPELRLRDFVTNIEDVKVYVKKEQNVSDVKYLKDPQYYNRKWSKEAKDVSLQVFEEIQSPSESQLETLRRQRLTSIVLNQVYVAWARYVSSLEDYQISQEIALTSEDIAEDVTITDGVSASKSALESATAIEDEVKAMKAYVELQDSLGNLYVTLGLDALPYYMLDEKISRIAVYLRKEFTKWRNGEFLPDNRPYLLDVPVKRPPINLSSSLMPDVDVETGERINITIPQAVFNKMGVNVANVISKAGLKGDRPLPKWLYWNEETHTLSGVAKPSDGGSYDIKIYIADKEGNVGYVEFNILINNVYIPSMDVNGLTKGRKVEILKRCVGSQCLDNYIHRDNLGLEVETGPKY